MYQDIVVFHKHKLTMAGTSEPEQHGTRRGTDKKTWETRERHRTSIFWENVLSHVWRCRYNVFFSKKYQEIVVFHKHKLTMAGTTELEQHGTRTGTEKKKHEKHKNTKAKKCTQGRPTPLSTFLQGQKNVLEGVPPPWVHFSRAKKCTQGRPTPLSTFLQRQKMYWRASHPLEYIFTRAKNVLEGVPPPWVHFYNGKKCTGGRPTPLSTFLQRQKMYWRASHALEYIFTRTKNVLEGVPPPWVHFYNGKKCTGGRPTPLSTFLQGQKMYWRASHPLEYIFTRVKKMYSRASHPLEYIFTFQNQKNVTAHVGRPWVHFLYSLSVKKMYWRGWEALEYIFILQKKNVPKGVGRPWVHFLYSSPVKKMYWRGWDPLQYILKKKCTGIRGTYFGSIFLGGGGVVFGLKKMYWRGWEALGYIFFCCFPPPPPPFWNPRGGGPKYIFNPPPPPRKNVHYIFAGPPLKLGVKGVGIIYLHVPGTCLSSILFVEPSKTGSFPIKTRGPIWVPGMCIFQR